MRTKGEVYQMIIDNCVSLEYYEKAAKIKKELEHISVNTKVSKKEEQEIHDFFLYVLDENGEIEKDVLRPDILNPINDQVEEIINVMDYCHPYPNSEWKDEYFDEVRKELYKLFNKE
jgi:hypothetical protein